MHTTLSKDRKKVYVTMGGNDALSLRIAVIDLHWKDGVPSPEIVKVLEMVDAGVPGNPANGAACRPSVRPERQGNTGPR